MSLSKPSSILYKSLEVYYNSLFNNPIRTKAICSLMIAVFGNLTSQYITGAKTLNQDSLISFGLFGFLFGGPLPHFFYEILERIIPFEANCPAVKQLFLERFLFTPLFQFFSLYMLARFEGKSHDQSMSQLLRLYLPVLKANWKWLTIFQFINFAFVPPIMRDLVNNIISFFWIIFLTRKKQLTDATKRNRLD
uniref:Peroxisomal membrane protein 2 n=1 Tax=Clastoptera arizonana TaxID=38151 RepID=A0A1B6CYY8_9HEMI